MRCYVFGLAMLTLAALAPAAVRGDDDQIAQQIVERLDAAKQTGMLKGFSIDLQVDEGTVWLSGRVASPEQQAKALDIARRIPGVVQVVNDLTVMNPSPLTSPVAIAPPPAPAPATVAAPASSSMLGNMGKALVSAVRRPDPIEEPKSTQPAAPSLIENPHVAIGSGVDSSVARASRQGVVEAAQPVSNVPQPLSAASMPPPATAPQAFPGAVQPMPYMVAVPVYAGSLSQVPMPIAPARTVNYQTGAEGAMGAPVPMYMPGSGVGIAPARYDHPHMPGYAWPSYAAYPNYAAVTYPKQYSPSAWPYIGPFYPYPQVPLGWRKVTLEWDDGWWMLDFKDRRSMYNKH